MSKTTAIIPDKLERPVSTNEHIDISRDESATRQP
ncbi:hypothetical protein HALLA_03060 (plasmid) [Halostagnicola larsenii XH-48]|uniref:Uncharacterized protein n=1 Tax=Halostagnicola larsenii XH-48 TaxID=797299 RepID=W0JVW9_9EURY|nr:hypothetical protein HALLA_03060 [Halostagnicola larsenii XH-48]